MTSIVENSMDSFLARTELSKKEVSNHNFKNMAMAVVGSGVIIGNGLSNAILCMAGETKSTEDTLNGNDGEGFVNNLNNGTASGGKLNGAKTSIIGILGDGYSIVRSGALILILIACIIAIVKLAGSSGQSSNDGKSGIIRGCIALLCLAALGSFVGLCFSIGGTLFDSDSTSDRSEVQFRD